MSFKPLHQFTVTLEREAKEITTREEGGQKITTESTVVKEIPYTVLLKELSRRERHDVALFQTIEYNEAVKKGMLPRLVMQEKIGKAAGSPLSEEEDKNLSAMSARLQELATDYIDLANRKDLPDVEEVKERKQKIVMEYMVLSKRVIDINASYQTVYAYTAEAYMQNKTLTWLILNLTYVKDTPEAAPRPFFAGANFDAKEQAWGDMEEAKDPLFQKAFERLSQYWALFYRGEASKSEDFVTFDENMKKQEEYERKMREEVAKGAVEKLTPETPKTDESEPPAATPVA